MKRKILLTISALALLFVIVFFFTEAKSQGKADSSPSSTLIGKAGSRLNTIRKNADRGIKKIVNSFSKGIGHDPADNGKTLPDQAELTRRLNAIVGKSKVDVALLDKKSGQQLTYSNGGSNFWLASSIKLSILTALVSQYGPLTGTDDQQAQAMITYSDNDSATYLFNELGGFPALEAFWARLSMTSTVSDYDGFGMSTSTAADQLKLLDYIRRLPADQKSYIMNLTGQVIPGQSFGVGRLKDAHFKNGWLNDDDGLWYVNSVGSVDDRYLIAIMTKNNLSSQAGERLTSRIARNLFNPNTMQLQKN
ncbi:LppW family protein [Oenococcus alcoholitolerans]|uniref:LppW family protein n=1 Tax=Oenococcus alcoholitolerans TaxID=931074 RepID=UPI003F6FC131